MKHQIRIDAATKGGVFEYRDGTIERRIECTCGKVLVVSGDHEQDPHGMELAWAYHSRPHAGVKS